MTDKHPQADRIAAKIAARLRAAEEEIAALKRIWEGSPKYGIGALLEAFNLCTDNGMPLPPWLAKAVRAELIGRVPKGSLIHYRRWREVRKMRDARPLTLDTAKMRPGRRYSYPDLPSREISYDATFKLVAQLLEKRPSAGSPKTIERSYGLVETDLPAREQYKPTYTKRKR